MLSNGSRDFLKLGKLGPPKWLHWSLSFTTRSNDLFDPSFFFQHFRRSNDTLTARGVGKKLDSLLRCRDATPIPLGALKRGFSRRAEAIQQKLNKMRVEHLDLQTTHRELLEQHETLRGEAEKVEKELSTQLSHSAESNVSQKKTMTKHRRVRKFRASFRTRRTERMSSGLPGQTLATPA